jgi:hypothetical protein
VDRQGKVGVWLGLWMGLKMGLGLGIELGKGRVSTIHSLTLPNSSLTLPAVSDPTRSLASRSFFSKGSSIMMNRP